MIVFVKHSQPEILPDVPAREWQLSDEGRRRCEPLAALLERYAPDIIVTSREPKASETGTLAAARLGLPCFEADNLHEHDRTGEAFGTAEDFRAKVQQFFTHPAQRVYGRESADEAHQRFTQAVDCVLETYPDRRICIAAHGTVISLYVARRTGQDAFSLWDQLGLPSVVVLTDDGQLEIRTSIR